MSHTLHGSQVRHANHSGIGSSAYYDPVCLDYIFDSLSTNKVLLLLLSYKRSGACLLTRRGNACPPADVEAVNIQRDGMPSPVAEELFIIELKRPLELWSLQKFKQNIARYWTAEFALNEMLRLLC